MATDSNRRIIWKWESDAFGSTVPQQDPDGDGKQTIVNLRFPGQYYDAESSLHQNWHRTYDPSLGRYISSDPIGLAGGVNTYGYVGQSPLNLIDPSGENALAVEATEGNKKVKLVHKSIQAISIALLYMATTLITGMRHSLYLVAGVALIATTALRKEGCAVETESIGIYELGTKE
ncbi:MAG: RHS repeat-associated core domain-containing protein [Candidatus Thiothrix singaporensis]|uniref:RHS repeat-associated core domain-containing protein n=1 Tax=Candidatus Thiothrix singaporensis TaxID=2799669 RepID=A0A7L6AYQ4_9GAMM|nr:MAG: RHS repeat-associated core domain-containing protein [Candidatus Thiothrix singaporensis]